MHQAIMHQASSIITRSGIEMSANFPPLRCTLPKLLLTL